MKKYTYSKGEGYPTIEIIGDGILRIDPEEFFRSPTLKKKIEALEEMYADDIEETRLAKLRRRNRVRQGLKEEEELERQLDAADEAERNRKRQPSTGEEKPDDIKEAAGGNLRKCPECGAEIQLSPGEAKPESQQNAAAESESGSSD